jgi:hypothetical protein
MKKMLLMAAWTLFAGIALGAAESRVTFIKPKMRWLWGGFGFHNSEATMTPIMSDEFRDQRVLKTFREISPTYSRLFAGYADWTKEAMDRFADYYDATFRLAGTTLYLVPGRMPTITEDFDPDVYAEAVAVRLEYLVKERKCTKIRYYTAANELSVGSNYCWFRNHWELYVKVMKALHRAFRRHGLDIGLMASDASGEGNFETIDWAIRDLNDQTEVYCWHKYAAYRPELYDELYTGLTNYVRRCLAKEKRLSLGEWGASAKKDWVGKMVNDGGTGFNYEGDAANLGAMARAEIGLCAMNAGCISAASWTFCDYPDPLLREDGDTAEEKARYDVARFSGHGVDVRYNKNGLFRWCDDEHDYSSYPDLYTMGYLVKLFRKGARMLPWTSDDDTLRAGGVTNPDGSASFAVINWGESKQITLEIPHPLRKPLRIYEYDSAHPPYNAFNDLQPAKGTVVAKGGKVSVSVPARSMTFLTTDYENHVPAAVTKIRIVNGRLGWAANEEPEHRYYRVYKDGKQIASTVATSLGVSDATSEDAPRFSVRSVDKWGGEGK